MLNRIFKTLTHYWDFVVVFGVILLVGIINLTPNSYLLGWDSLQTDLNPILGIKRALFSVWQEFQSFGLTAGMAHAADLPRAVFILLMSFILPDPLIRYVFHLLTFLSAGFGMIIFLKYLFHKEAESKHTNKAVPLIGALFYIFNFAILQLMFLPFEPFAIFFASVPWLVWSYLKILDGKTNWILFLLLNFLATSSFVTQQLFVVYGLLLSLLTGGYLFSILLQIQKKEKIPTFLKLLKRSLFAALLISIVNLYWILPQGYFLLTNGDVVRESKINQLATTEVLYNNQSRGSLSDFASYTSFYYDRLGQNQGYLFASWRLHRENPVMVSIIYSLFAVVLLGVFSKGRYKTLSSRPVQIGFLLLFTITGITLLGNTPGIKELNDLIRDNSFINQIFRSPFTKFAVPLAFATTYFFICGILSLTTFLKKHVPTSISRITPNLILFVLGFFTLFQALPVFQGQLFSTEMKVQIPQRYFELMNYFESVDKNERITLLPDYTFWGWYQTNYGYNGSGYLWYGINQPIVSRNFDYWSFESESYFWEIKNAVEAEDQEMMNNVFEKYDIDYIVLDKSLLPIVTTQKSLQYDILERMLNQNSTLIKEKTWDSLIIYKRISSEPKKSYISLAKNVPNIGPSAKLINDDSAYKKYGTYQTSAQNPFDAYYPFLDLFTQTKNVSDDWMLEEKESNILVTASVPFNTKEYIATDSSQAKIDLYDADTAVNYIVPFETTLTDQTVSISFPKVRIDSFSPETANIGYCLSEQGEISSYKSQNAIDITTVNGATGCIDFADSNLDQRYGYLISTQTENISGPPLYFYILDTTKNQAYVEDRILSDKELFVLGPHYLRGLGYSFTFQNTSYPHIPSTNRVFGLQVYLMPYEEIHTYELMRQGFKPPTEAQFEKEFNAKQENYYSYTVSNLPKTSDQTLILYQSYQPGWSAYTVGSGILESLFPYLFAKKITDHTVINNWANGWNIANSSVSQIKIIYLPQYLQYIGFGVLIITVIGITLASIRGKKRL